MSSYTPELIPEERLEKMVETLKVLGHPTRLQIVIMLMNGEHSVGELVKKLGIKQPITSSYLSKLRFSGVLISRRDGNVTYYSIKNSGVKNIVASIIRECI